MDFDEEELAVVGLLSRMSVQKGDQTLPAAR